MTMNGTNIPNICDLMRDLSVVEILGKTYLLNMTKIIYTDQVNIKYDNNNI